MGAGLLLSRCDELELGAGAERAGAASERALPAAGAASDCLDGFSRAGAGREAAGAGRLSFSFSLSSDAVSVAAEAANRRIAPVPSQGDNAVLRILMSFIGFSTSPLKELFNSSCSHNLGSFQRALPRPQRYTLYIQ